ncbi:MAG: SAM-dependent methyltransferase [Gaiellaceae bacterium MAG52_C11]|nr:SAM-dependent methyltransferase [Candidatus Gaiellasilicea maunaloa]
MPALAELVARLFDEEELTRAVISKPRVSGLPARIVVEPIELRGRGSYRFTTHLADRTTHENLPVSAARERVTALLAEYGQALLQSAEADWQVLGETVLRRAPTRPTVGRRHDRRKRYLIEEGIPVPFLVELGVMTATGQIRKSRYGKFRQVNRFLELVDDIVPLLPARGTLRVVDFGCGKSYLTFALHHLLTKIHGREVEIVGLDLKRDVIDACSALAEHSGLAGLRFEFGEIGNFDAKGEVDLVVSLHACDTATDDALAQAVGWRPSAILAVPCCHKEAYGQIRSDQLAPLLRHGLARERFAALATDALRAQLLELTGYRTQLVEFVELEHTAKNILIRAVRAPAAGAEAQRSYNNLRDSLGLSPTLERLLRR